ENKGAARQAYSAQRNAAAPVAADGGTGEPPVPTRSADVVANTEVARRLLVQGRRALQDGKLDIASRCADAALARRPDLAYWEDNPERLKHDIQRATDRTAGEVSLVARKTQESGVRGQESAGRPSSLTPDPQLLPPKPEPQQ